MPSVILSETAAMRGQLTNAQQALQYLLAGHSFVTVVRKANGHRYTYKVVARQNIDLRWHYVHVLYGPDNGRNYRYLGTLWAGNKFTLTRKSKLPMTDKRIQVFTWLLQQLQRNHMPAGVELWHEGRCGRCGRRLTVPGSIASGYGPECSATMGLQQQREQAGQQRLAYEDEKELDQHHGLTGYPED